MKNNLPALFASLCLSACVKSGVPEQAVHEPRFQDQVCDLMIERTHLQTALKASNYDLENLDENLALAPPSREKVCGHMTMTTSPNALIHRAEVCAIQLEKARYDDAMDLAMNSCDNSWSCFQDARFVTPAINQDVCGETVEIPAIENIPKGHRVVSTYVVLDDGRLISLQYWHDSTDIVVAPPNKFRKDGGRGELCDVELPFGPSTYKFRFQGALLTAVNMGNGYGYGGYTQRLTTGYAPSGITVPDELRSGEYNYVPEEYQPEYVTRQEVLATESVGAFVHACEAELESGVSAILPRW